MDEINRIKENLINYIEECKFKNKDDKFLDITESDIDECLTVKLANKMMELAQKSFDKEVLEESYLKYVEKSYKKGYEIGYLGTHINSKKMLKEMGIELDEESGY